jgi:hypothetical protein
MTKDNEKITFCQEPSKRYLDLLDECGGDPRSVAGMDALYNSAKGHSVQPIDARISDKSDEGLTADKVAGVIIAALK